MALIRFFKPTLRRIDMDAVLQTMVDEKIGPSEKRKQFLKLLCESLKMSDGLVLRTYIDAITLAIESLKLEKNSLIAISVLSPKVYDVVLKGLGYEIFLLDISSQTGCVSQSEIKRAEESGCKAIIIHEPVSQIPYDLDKSLINIPIIEDVSESLFSEFDSFKAGSLGDIIISSFEEESLISTAGGACVLAKKSEYIDSFKKVSSRYKPYFELPDLNASLGCVQFKNIESNLKRRRELHQLFSQALLKSNSELFGVKNIDFKPSGFNFPVICNSRPDDIITFCAKYSVSVKRSFTHTVGIDYQERFDLFPNAAIALSRGLSFPLYPFLKPKEVEAIVKVLSHLPQ